MRTNTTTTYLPVPLLCFVCWLLLLLVTVSTPITRNIYLAQVNANVDVGGTFDVAKASTQLRFGVYGWCSSGVHAEAAGGLISHNEPAVCSPKHLGYDFDSDVLDRLNINIADNISHTLTFGLSTHLVATVLSFVALVLSLVTLCRMSRMTAAATTMFILLATLFALIAFIFDIVFATTTKHILAKGHDFISVKVGNGTWMTLSAFILLLVASIMSCIGCVRVGRAGRQDEKTARY